MINNRAGQSPMEIEQMSITIGNVIKEIIKSSLSDKNKIVYDNYANLFASSIEVNIIQSPEFIEVTRFTDQVVQEDNLEFNYTTIVKKQKSIIDAFIKLVNNI